MTSYPLFRFTLLISLDDSKTLKLSSNLESAYDKKWLLGERRNLGKVERLCVLAQSIGRCCQIHSRVHWVCKTWASSETSNLTSSSCRSPYAAALYGLAWPVAGDQVCDGINFSHHLLFQQALLQILRAQQPTTQTLFVFFRNINCPIPWAVGHILQQGASTLTVERQKLIYRSKGVNLSFGASGLSKSTRMVEVGNCLLQKMPRKPSLGEWDEKLAPATQQVHAHVIQHMLVASLAIFFGGAGHRGEPWLGAGFYSHVGRWYVGGGSDQSYNVFCLPLFRNIEIITLRCTIRITRFALEKKERDAMRYNAEEREIFHEVGSLVIVYQKKRKKKQLNSSLDGEAFVGWITGLGGTQGLSWRISQHSMVGKFVARTYSTIQIIKKKPPFVPK